MFFCAIYITNSKRILSFKAYGFVWRKSEGFRLLRTGYNFIGEITQRAAKHIMKLMNDFKSLFRFKSLKYQAMKDRCVRLHNKVCKMTVDTKCLFFLSLNSI